MSLDRPALCLPGRPKRTLLGASRLTCTVCGRDKGEGADEGRWALVGVRMRKGGRWRGRESGVMGVGGGAVEERRGSCALYCSRAAVYLIER